MVYGAGSHTYEVQEGWGQLPEGWNFGWIPAVAVDSQDRVYVYSRSEHPMVVFDREGNFLTSWGDDILTDAHGIFIDAADNIYCVDRETHVMHKFTTDGERLMSIGTHGQPGAEGEPCVLVADRGNNRIQFFTLDGEYIQEWGEFLHPDTIFIDDKDIVYIAELDQRVTILTLDGEVIAQWGSERGSEVPGEFFACPHGIWVDSHGDIYVSEVQADGRLQKFIRQG